MPMNTKVLRAREMSLALLVFAVMDHGHLQADLSGARPQTSGLMRLGRDLMRRTGTEPAAEAVAATSSFSPKGRIRGTAD